jgi:alkanesulfonate monooxygenase SsuD/methylene tetrahydromethanopterin reductase-like flavin-dependent oxidoreductase (luciferase family)
MDLGLCVRDVGGRELADLGRFAQDHGYTDVYVPDLATGGRDAFVALAALFAATTTVRGAVGVAAVIARAAPALAVTAASLNEQSEGRFALGIGVSHREMASTLGVEFPAAPVEYMRDWLARMRQASAGGVAFGGGWPVLLGALGPRMTELGASAADGLVLNWMTPEHAASSVGAVRALGSARTVLYVRLMAGDAVAQDARNYDALANYHRHFVAQGLTDVDAIVAGTTLPLNDLAQARERIEQYRASGLDLLCVYPHALPPAQRDHALAELTR